MVKKAIKYLALIFLLCACGQTNNQNQKEKETKTKKEVLANAPESNSSYIGFLASIAKIQTSDKGRVLESGQGFFVEEDAIVTRLSMMKDANRATFTTLADNKKHNIVGYLAIDRINDLILLKTDGTTNKPIPLFKGIAPLNSKTIYLTRPTGKTIPLHRGKILKFSNSNGGKVYTVSNIFRSASYGAPVFVSNLQTIGMAYSEVVDLELQHFVIPSSFISELINKKEKQVHALENMNQADKAISEVNSKIKGLLVETDYGTITIRLFNETPAYRDNFIKLVREQYFDSLLFHRVIKGFCIQSGAADTRYAENEDVVGWKGPGYTLPAHIVPHFYHKRGMIGSPRKPDTKNAKRRSDGSQFYIVTGRTYNNMELKEIETQNNIVFTAEQRKTYSTLGGAPHIDGSYTIFGEVTSGMDVVDQISKVAIGREFRPLQDIRIKRISILP